jgi:hypothetical protein
MPRKSIYGACNTVVDCIELTKDCTVTLDPTIESTLLKFAELIRIMSTSIEKYLPAVSIRAPLRGNVATPLYVPAIIMVRLLWKDRYPGAKANKDEYFYRSAIRDIYFEINRASEWNNDPLSKL